MYYGFDAHPLIYVAAALAIFGIPMTCIFLAAMRAMNINSHSPKPPPQILPRRVINLPQPVPVKKPRVTRKRALRIEWVSLPIDQDKV